MTESEAFAVALEYAGKNGVSHYGCKCKGFWSGRDVHLGLESAGFPKGIRRRIWYFHFALCEEDTADTVTTGGGYVVYVDDDTGTCGHLYAI